ncbi:MAG: DUF2070 family protein [Candidatus Nezhaarchaeota archaeon]|nr:DUF2070 family protein [Candidatus Nezhaarchaeota archaeon]
MSSAEEAIKAYDMLFRLPRTLYLASSIVVMSLLPVTISHRPLHTFIAWMSPPLLVAALTYVLRSSKLLTWRRCLGTVAAGLSAQVVTYLILALLTTALALNNLTKMLSLTSSAVFTVTHVVSTQPLTERKACALLPAPLSFILLSTVHALAYGLELSTAAVSASISQTIGLSLAYLCLKLIDVTASDHQIGGLKLFRAFASSWLLNDPSLLEAAFRQRGETVRIQVTSLIFKSQRRIEGCFITFDAHPGPFRNVAGSNLPADISKVIEQELGGVCFVFHSTASHDRDPVDKEEAAKIVKAALQASVKASKLTKPLYTGPTCSKEVEPHVCCQILGIPIISVTWRSQRAEDLPHTLGAELKAEAMKLGFVNALVIDAHNYHLPNESPPKLNLNEVKARVVKTINETIRGKTAERVEAAFKTIDLPRSLGKVDEVGEAGIKLALINVGSSSSAYVLVDANNVSPSFHRAFLSRLSNQGLDFVEIYTTDTHSVVGLKLIRGGYRALGEGPGSNEVISLIRESINSLREQLVEVEVGVGTEEVEVSVIGERGLASFLRQLKRGLWALKITLPTTYLLSIILPLLITIQLYY